MMQCCPNSPVTWQDNYAVKANKVERDPLYDKGPATPKQRMHQFRMIVATDVIRDPGVCVGLSVRY